ncbi:hypothetical protein SAMD00023353_5500330 [Rosellinia necatrix]|uniref:Uncharacterized protein n=1 Tax=Rosellinia necatrix TaxID=77044 RepID=A0A1S8A9X3_ROSNE|nr:hypothetical protein SAMD00023353_5500330 [Rosellinia necatrix]
MAVAKRSACAGRQHGRTKAARELQRPELSRAVPLLPDPRFKPAHNDPAPPAARAPSPMPLNESHVAVG